MSEKTKTISFNPVIGDHHLKHLFYRNVVFKNQDLAVDTQHRKKFDKSYLFIHNLIRYRFNMDLVEITIEDEQFECKDVFLIEKNKSSNSPDIIEVIGSNHYKVHPEIFVSLKKYKEVLSSFFALTEEVVNDMLIEEHEANSSLYVQIEYGIGEVEDEDDEEDDDEEDDEEQDDV